MDHNLLNVILGFIAIGVVAIPILLLWDRRQKKKIEKLVERLQGLEIDPTETVRCAPSSKKIFLLLLGSLAFVIIGIGAIFDGDKIGWLCVGFFGLCFLVAAMQLLPGCSYLILSPEGFEYCSLYRKFSYNWHEIRELGVTNISGNEMVCINFSDDYDNAKLGRKISTGLTGVEGSLPDTYGFSAFELAEIMQVYKDYNEQG